MQPSLPEITKVGIIVLTTIAVYTALIFSYKKLHKNLPRKTALLITFLKFSAIAVLLLLLFQPILNFALTQNLDKTVLVMVDKSASMGIKDSIGNNKRFNAAVKSLESLMPNINSKFKTKFCAFDSKITEISSLEDFTPLKTDSKFSQISESINHAISKYSDENVIAVILYSDGNENSYSIFEPKKFSVPVFAVGTGSAIENNPFFQDLSIDVESPTDSIVNNIIEIKVRAKISGNKFRKQFNQLPVTLFSNTAELIRKEILTFAPNEFSAELIIKVTPSTPGKISYKVSLPVFEEESITANNSKEITINVRNPKIKILYVEGSPRYEFKGIVNTLDSDPNVELTALMNYGTGSYAAIGKKNSEIDLSAGLPKIIEDYKFFDVVILGDMPVSDLSQNQLLTLKNWVSSSNGNLIMLAGIDSLNASWAETNLYEIIPVNLESDNKFIQKGKFNINLTEDGLIHPICKGLENYFSDNPELRTFNNICGFRFLKPGAENLISVKDNDFQTNNLLVVANAGSGRIVVNGLINTWKNWSFAQSKSSGKTMFAVFWGQMIRWISGRKDDTPTNPVTLILPEKILTPGTEIPIKAIVFSKNNRFIDDAKVILEITQPKGENIVTELTRVGNQPGLYKFEFTPQWTGKYKISCKASANNEFIGEIEDVFTVGMEISEFYKISLNSQYLRDVAKISSGEYYTLMTVNQLPQSLKKLERLAEKEEITEFSSKILLFLVFVTLVSIEWFLRRRNHII